MTLTVECEREDDGRWITDAIDRSGAMSYGTTREETLAAVKALALRVLADRLEHGELTPDLPDLTFRAKPLSSWPYYTNTRHCGED